MIEIKGSAVRDTIKAVKERFGDQIYDSILNLLKEETRSIFKNESVMPMTWYPLDAFVEFLEMDLRVTAHGDEQELIKRSEILFERQLGGIYRAFIKLGSPSFVLNVNATVNRTYFRGVDIEVNMPSPGKAIMKYTGFEKQHRLIGMSIIGFYRKALEISGAKDISAEFITAIGDDKGYSELGLNWKDK